MKIGITGGAGFIGSHLAEKLKQKHEVVVIDNLSSGIKANIPENIELREKDLKKDPTATLFDLDALFHFAANPKVNTFPKNLEKDFNENLKATKNILDACVSNNIENLVFASSSVVYGENAEIPTPETHNLDPISMYGATKAGGEHMSKVYSQTFDIDLTIVRLANIVGKRNQKGVVYDFIQKLEENPEKLKILGNGEQKKSYLHVKEAVKGIIQAWEADDTIYNIGSEDSISVDEIADIVADQMNINPEYEYTGGEKGWEGDVPEMRLDITKLKEDREWRPLKNSRESIIKTVKELR